MNKLTLAAAVALCASVGFSEGIASNIVGYNTTDLNPSGKFTTIVVPFLNVTDSTKNLSLYDLSGNWTQNDFSPNADQIWIWEDGIGWDKYFINASGVWKQTSGEKKEFSVVYPDGLPEGTGLYIKTKGADAKNVTGSGAVETQDQVSTVMFGNGKFTFVGNPYPTVLDIQNGDQFEISGVTKNDFSPNADQVWIWEDGIAWDKYFINAAGQWKQTSGEKKLFSTVYPNGLPVGSVLYIKAKGSDAKEAVFKKTF